MIKIIIGKNKKTGFNYMIVEKDGERLPWKFEYDTFKEKIRKVVDPETDEFLKNDYSKLHTFLLDIIEKTFKTEETGLNIGFDNVEKGMEGKAAPSGVGGEPAPLGGEEEDLPF